MHCQTGKEYAKYCVPMGLRANGHHSVYCIMEHCFPDSFSCTICSVAGLDYTHAYTHQIYVVARHEQMYNISAIICYMIIKS